MPGAPRSLEALGILAIRDHERESGVEAAIRHGIDERLQIAAASGDQHADPAAANWTPGSLHVADGGLTLRRSRR